VEGSEHVII